MAEELSDFAGGVVVVYAEGVVWFCVADGAFAVLLFDHLLVLVFAEAVLFFAAAVFAVCLEAVWFVARFVKLFVFFAGLAAGALFHVWGGWAAVRSCQKCSVVRVTVSVRPVGVRFWLPFLRVSFLWKRMAGWGCALRVALWSVWWGFRLVRCLHSAMIWVPSGRRMRMSPWSFWPCSGMRSAWWP